MKIQEYLKSSPLLFDGAMGTYFAKDQIGVRCEEANLTEPNRILAIHKAYLNAGAKAIKTNTFGANTIYLESDFAHVKEVILAGIRIAREAVSQKNAYLFADIGPVFDKKKSDILAQYKKIFDVFLSQEIDHFLLETLPSDNQILELCQYIKEQNPNAFILVQFAVTPDGYTKEGQSGYALYEKACQSPHIDAVGFNCVSGPLHLLEYMKTLPQDENTHLSIMPNAGYPTVIGGRTVFADNAEYFSDKLAQMVLSGAQIVGGCCGTTPEHIKKAAEKLKSLPTPLPQKKAVPFSKSPRGIATSKNPLFEQMNRGEKIIAVELDPPANSDIHFFMESAKSLVESGANAITIADCPIARMRADSSLLAAKLKRECHITPLPHMTCRDRNLNATKALLLGLSIEEVSNVLIVTGDPIPSAERDEIKGVYNFNSTKLARYITDLNQNTLKNPFTIYGALNINAANFDTELNRAKRKIENGVSAFLTQPLLSKAAFENLQKAYQTLPAKILCGIIPVVSYKNACYMDSEISGIRVCDEIKELYRDLSREEAEEMAISISGAICQKAASYCHGYYLITPFNRVSLVNRIIKTILS